MHCRRFPTPDGKGYVIICGSRPRTPPCSSCGASSSPYQCDWKLHGKKKGKTCDRHLCERCATAVGENKHLCPPHLREWERHPANPKNASSATPPAPAATSAPDPEPAQLGLFAASSAAPAGE